MRGRIGKVRAATAVEYALLLSCIFLASVVSANNLATSLSAMWNNVSTDVNRAP